MLGAQVLYCIRSSARIIKHDSTYFGRHLPSWTYTCLQIGNISNMLQHWMYTQVYLDAALTTKLYFGPNNYYNNIVRRKRERIISIINGILYITFLTVLITDFFMDSDVAQTMMYAILSAVMVIALGYSMSNLSNILEKLKNNGLSMRRAIIIIQLVLLTLITILSFVYFLIKKKFMSDCKDDVQERSLAGLLTRTFQMSEMIVWRFVTASMCMLLFHHANAYKKDNLSAVERQLQSALNSDDEDHISIGDLDSSSTSEESVGPTTRKPDGERNHMKKRKRELILVILSISKGKFKILKQVQRSISSTVSTVDFSLLSAIKPPTKEPLNNGLISGNNIVNTRSFSSSFIKKNDLLTDSQNSFIQQENQPRVYSLT